MAEVLGKVASAFTATTDTMQQLDDADDLQFTLPEASLFDDSLDEDFCPKAIDHATCKADDVAKHQDEANLDDSLCWEGGADLAPEDTDLSCHDSIMHPLSASTDDSLIPHNGTECNLEKSAKTEECSTKSPSLPAKTYLSNQKVPESKLEVDPVCLSVAIDNELFPENLFTDKNSSSKVSPDAAPEDNPSTGMVSTVKPDQGDSQTSKSESPAVKSLPDDQSANKVVPSFGKKKNRFMTPSAVNAVPSKCIHVTAKYVKRKSDADASAGQKEVTPSDRENRVHEQDNSIDEDKENSPTRESRKSKCNQPQAAETIASPKVEESSPDKGKKKKSEKSTAKTQELEEKRKERELKKQAQDHKKQERELKKQEKEQKKSKKDRLKEEKRLEQERKKAEREQKRLEAELKKIERDQKKAGKKAGGKTPKSQNETKSSGEVSSCNSESGQQLEQERRKCPKDCPDTSPVEAQPLQADNTSTVEGSKSTESAKTDVSVSTDAAAVSIGSDTPHNVSKDHSQETSPQGSPLPAETSPEGLSVDKPSLESLPDEHTLSPNADFGSGESAAAVDPLSPELHPGGEMMLPCAFGKSVATEADHVESYAAADTDKEDGDHQSTVADGHEDDYNSDCNTVATTSAVSTQPRGSIVELCSGASKASRVTTDEASRQKPWKPPPVATTSKAGKNSVKKAKKRQQTSKKNKLTVALKSEVAGTISTTTAPHGSKMKSQQLLKKMKHSNTTPAKTKTKKRKAAETESSSSGDGDRESDSASEEPERKRSKPMNYSGPVWVQCGRAGCGKWRQLTGCLDPSDVPESWECSMNTDTACNSCSTPEEQWSDLGDSQEFVESLFVPGSIVWAKMDGYPWWPAMVEEDPDSEAYYGFGKSDSNVPVRYHVVFFDTPVCRGWVSSAHILALTEGKDVNKEWNVHVAQKYRKGLNEGLKQAMRALEMSASKRLSQFGFAKRFRRSTGRKRKRFFDEGAESSHSSRAGHPKPGTHKSVRVGGSLSRTAPNSSYEDDKRGEKEDKCSKSAKLQPGAVKTHELQHSAAGEECSWSTAAEKDSNQSSTTLNTPVKARTVSLQASQQAIMDPEE